MTIKLNLSTKVDPKGLSELFLRVVLSREHIYRIKSGIFVPKNAWNQKTEKIIVPRLHTEMQEAMIQLQVKINQLVQKLTEMLYGTPMQTIDKETIVSFVKAFHNENASSCVSQEEKDTFKAAFESFIRLQVKTEKRAQQYKCLWKQMMRFAVYKKGFFAWDFDISADDILDFELFLLDEPNFFDEKKQPKMQYKYIYEGIDIPKRMQRGKNAVACIIKRLRIFFNWAEKSNLFTCQNPFLNYHSHQCVYGTPFFMTKDEIDTLYHTDFSYDPQLEFHRDLFVFQSNVGMRVGDLFSLTRENIVNGENLEYIPSKTISHSGNVVSVPLTRVAKEILKKYSCDNDTRIELFPFSNTQYYNKDIKTMLRKAGITRIVTIYDPLTNTNVQRPICEIAASHMARRNFIGNLYNKVADPNIIGSMTGHVDGSRAFARYRTIGEDLKKKALSALE